MQVFLRKQLPDVYENVIGIMGARGGVVVKALHYKPAGRGFDSRWSFGSFQWHNPSGRNMALTEMSTRCISWG